MKYSNKQLTEVNIAPTFIDKIIISCSILLLPACEESHYVYF